jgi:hypothetical protein
MWNSSSERRTVPSLAIDWYILIPHVDQARLLESKPLGVLRLRIGNPKLRNDAAVSVAHDDDQYVACSNLL